MDYNALIDKEKELVNSAEETLKELNDLKEDYKKYDNLEERLANGEVISNADLETAYQMNDQIEDLRRTYNSILCERNKISNDLQVAKDSIDSERNEAQGKDYSLMKERALEEIEHLEEKQKTTNLGYSELRRLEKAKIDYQTADWYSKYYGKVNTEYYDQVFADPTVGKQLDVNEFNAAGSILKVEREAKILRAKKEFGDAFDESKIDQYIALYDAKENIEKLQKSGMSTDEISKYLYSNSMEDKMVNDEIHDIKEEVDFENEAPTLTNDDDQVVADDLKYQDVPDALNNLEVAEEVKDNNFTPDEQKAVNDLTPEEEKAPIKIGTASHSLMGKIKGAKKSVIIGIVALAGSVALALTVPAVGTLALGAVVGAGAKEFSAGRKA